ncbi:hypothetical protein B5807_00041 [Epicoccum nigrum]|uniref:Uncharacterized protein n=1 Tax=Epicoccum nigrum TaxID=105696 RepID=A0A1Y2MG65_EPING|nr:hypothetical protein B5807_00041 [Epicoccum nigrum]
MRTNNLLLLATFCLSTMTGALAVPRATPKDILAADKQSRATVVSRLYHAIERGAIIESIPDFISIKHEREPTPEVGNASGLDKRIWRGSGGNGGRSVADLDKRIWRGSGGNGGRSVADLDKRIWRGSGGNGGRSVADLEKRIWRGNGSHGGRSITDLGKRIVRGWGWNV